MGKNTPQVTNKSGTGKVVTFFVRLANGGSFLGHFRQVLRLRLRHELFTNDQTFKPNASGLARLNAQKLCYLDMKGREGRSTKKINAKGRRDDVEY